MAESLKLERKSLFVWFVGETGGAVAPYHTFASRAEAQDFAESAQAAWLARTNDPPSPGGADAL